MLFKSGNPRFSRVKKSSIIFQSGQLYMIYDHYVVPCIFSSCFKVTMSQNFHHNIPLEQYIGRHACHFIGTCFSL